MRTHNLTIADQHITVRSAATPAYVGRLAATLDERVRRVAEQGADRAGAALVVALGLADELARLEEALTETRAQLDVTHGSLRAAHAALAAAEDTRTAVQAAMVRDARLLRAAAGLPTQAKVGSPE